MKIYFDYDNVVSNFIFQSGFKIDDKDWFLKNKKIRNEFLQVVFPFIREKIYSLTSDNNTGLLIPIIDYYDLDLEKEIMIVKR